MGLVVGAAGNVVERGAQGFVVEVRALHLSSSLRRSARAGGFPPSSGIRAARPRAMRLRTVPGGMERTSLISA
jgi:hypothetical protein